MQKTYILISILVLVGAGALAWFNFSKKDTSLVACTMEAKLCPDGSAVGRTGPNCEFVDCPKVEVPPKPIVGEVTLGVGEKGKAGDLDITVNKFVSDSRCPSDVQCIWAGEFKANITLATPLKSETRNISSIDAPYTFNGYSISILSVAPAPKSTTKIVANNYRITFHVELGTASDVGSTGTVTGKVTLSPTCPVERMPPDPKCAPKPYQTKIEIFSSESGKLIKSIQSGSNGDFSATLPFGFYKLEAGAGTMLPRCSPASFHLETLNYSADISCDTGIR